MRIQPTRATLRFEYFHGAMFSRPETLIRVPVIQGATPSDVVDTYLAYVAAKGGASTDQSHPVAILRIHHHPGGNCSPHRSAVPRKLGLIGGMGPSASNYFLKTILPLHLAQCRTPVEITAVYACCTPDRTAVHLNDDAQGRCIIDRSLREINNYLGIDTPKGILCNTAHIFGAPGAGHEAAVTALTNMVECTRDYLAQAGVRELCFLGTDGTKLAGIYNDITTPRDGAWQGGMFFPGEAEQAETMAIIYEHVKREGVSDRAVARFVTLIELLATRHKQKTFGLFCTELPLVAHDARTERELRRRGLSASMVDPMQQLAKGIFGAVTVAAAAA